MKKYEYEFFGPDFDNFFGPPHANYMGKFFFSKWPEKWFSARFMQKCAFFIFGRDFENFGPPLLKSNPYYHIPAITVDDLWELEK